MMRRWLSMMLILLLFPLSAAAGEARLYVFGNSLINHLEGGDETAVPYWLAKQAKAGGHSFRLDGQWGFLRDFIRKGEPSANWSFKGVRGAWDASRTRFAEADLTAIMVNPANFIQYQWPDAPYDGDNPDGLSPLAAMEKLIDMRGAGRPILIYEGWAEMAGIASRFPPRARGLRKYHAFNMVDYHAWYVKLADQLKSTRPEADIRLIPVARNLSQLLTEKPFSDIPVTELYLDDAPHGTPTLYLLAAMAVYPALYGTPAPVLDTLPDSVSATLRSNQSLASQRLFEMLGDALEAKAGPTPEAAKTPVKTALKPAPAQAGQIANPSLAMGLDGVSDWSTQHPFLNVMKTARPWVGHVGGEWGALQMSDLETRGLLDKHGYPRRIPAEASKLETFVFTDQPAEATDMAARYRVRWKGEGKLTVTGRGQTARMGNAPNETWLTYTPGEGLVAIGIESTDPKGIGNYIRDIEIVREDLIPLFDAGAQFNPAWIARVENLRSLRFMDWMLTNGSPITSWEGRPKRAHFSYAWRGVPAEVMIDLANQIGADPWFSMPHAADDAYMRRFAELTKASLDPRLIAYVEYSNELWNHIFPQTKWAADEARKRWGPEAEGDAWMQFAGLRAAEVMGIWSDVYGAQAKARLRRVMGVHTGWLGLEEPFLKAPRAVAEGLAPPNASFDAYAVSGYFGYDLGVEEENLPKVRQIVAESRARAEAAARQKGLQRKALEAEIAPVKFDAAFAPVAELLWEGSFKELTEVFWPYHAKVAADHGMQLVMYEGGTHVTPHGEALADEELVAFFAAFNYDAEMGKLYEELLRRWRDVGGTLFNAFVDVAKPTQYGSWGALRHLQDENPRWDALMAANAIAPDLPPRAPTAFLQGVTVYGGQGPDKLMGTPEEDALVGGPGDDHFFTAGGSDVLNGGPGEDVAELPGKAADYRIWREGALVIAQSAEARIQLLSVEKLYFTGEPTRKYRLAMN